MEKEAAVLIREIHWFWSISRVPMPSSSFGVVIESVSDGLQTPAYALLANQHRNHAAAEVEIRERLAESKLPRSDDTSAFPMRQPSLEMQERRIVEKQSRRKFRSAN